MVTLKSVMHTGMQRGLRCILTDYYNSGQMRTVHATSKKPADLNWVIIIEPDMSGRLPLNILQLHRKENSSLIIMNVSFTLSNP